MIVVVFNGWVVDRIAGKESWRLTLVCGHMATAIIGPPECGRMPDTWDCVACDEQRKTKEVADGS